MGFLFFLIVICMLSGGLVFFGGHHHNNEAGAVAAAFNKSASQRQQFSPHNTLFLIGPTHDHQACRIQRRLLKPALATLIREDISVIELYGEQTPMRNGALLDWLDPSLLRHAMNAQTGFHLIFVNKDGKTLIKNNAPMVTADILARTGLNAGQRLQLPAPAGKSLVLKKLRAA